MQGSVHVVPCWTENRERCIPFPISEHAHFSHTHRRQNLETHSRANLTH